MIRKRIGFPLLLVAFLVGGCSLPGLGGNSETTIRISTLTTSESATIGHIVRLMIEKETDLNVSMVENLGTSLIAHQALKDKQVDITAARYTGTDIAGALGADPISDPEEAMAFVKKEFEERFDHIWYDSYGFSNTYAFTVTEELAESKGLKKISDVEEIADELTLGVDNSWLNRKGDGYDGFIEAYGFSFGQAMPMSLGLVYQAVRSGEMDVVLAYSTDGRLNAFDLVTLEDDKQFFPPYDSSPVTRRDVIEKHPKIDEILKKLAGKIDNEKIKELNYEADVNNKEPAIVAKEFLEENNYFN